MISVLKPRCQRTVAARPLFVANKGDVSTQCNFFAKFLKDSGTQATKNVQSASTQCTKIENGFFISRKKDQYCQTTLRRSYSKASQAPEEKTTGHSVIDTAVYLLKSMPEFENLHYNVSEDFIYLFSLPVEMKFCGIPVVSVSILSSGKCFLHRPFLDTVIRQIPYDSPVENLLQLFRETTKSVILCNGVFQEENKTNFSHGCKIWYDEATVLSNKAKFVCSPCKIQLRNLKRRQNRILDSPDRFLKRMQADSTCPISCLSPRNKAARISAIRKSKLCLAKKLRRLSNKWKHVKSKIG